jgi:hypothetical protein
MARKKREIKCKFVLTSDLNTRSKQEDDEDGNRRISRRSSRIR